MQDIDFDEIDRAVSSVTNTDTETSTVAAAATTVPTLVSTPEPITAPAVSLAARRSSGRFMDVVHPSSDMRPAAPSAPSLHREEVAPVVEAVPVSTRPAPAAIASSAFHWPEPIGTAQPSPIEVESIPEPISAPEPVIAPAPVFTPIVETPPPPAPAPEPVAAPTPEPAPELVTTPLELEEVLDTPLESPFLNDAKVEKRPLGAFSSQEFDTPLLETLDDVAPAYPSDPIVDVPAEAAVIEIPAIEAPVEEAVSEEPEEELLLEAHTETSHFKEAVATPEMLAGPTSITQQYKEQQSADTQESGAIYDTDAYHQALVHQPPKQHKGLIFVWIAALLLVGGGIGAAVYFFVLPLL